MGTTDLHRLEQHQCLGNLKVAGRARMCWKDWGRGWEGQGLKTSSF